MLRREGFWAHWLLAVAISFGVLEYEAYRGRKRPTLSRVLARWLRCEPHRRNYLGPAALAGAGAVLAVHIARLRPLDD